MEFKCTHCGHINVVDLSAYNLSESAAISPVSDAESEEVQSLKEQLKEKEVLVQRQQEELRKAQSGISSAISKTEKPSVEIQGEVAEEILFDSLRKIFNEDEFRSVKKGERGADILQIVVTPSGHQAGSILYESKSTKSWSSAWVSKLRSDMQEAGATAALLVSKAFPAKEKEVLVQLDDRIWLCKPGSHVPALVRAIRQGILMGSRRAVLDEFSSRTDKESLYEYITGDFVEQIKNIVRVYTDLSDELIKEQNAFRRKWVTRQKTLDRLADSMTGIVGSIQEIGVESMKLEKIKELSLD